MAPSRPSKTPAGDGALIRTFFEKRESLLLFLASRTHSMATAEDLVQDLYLKLASVDAGADVRAPSALLYRMAVNLLVDHARSTQRSARRSGQWRMETRASLGGEDIVDEPAADEVVVAKQRVRQLADAVAALPPQMGRAFRLHKLEGLSQAQTAQAMGVSTKMVEQHIQAAIRHLTLKLRA